MVDSWTIHKRRNIICYLRNKSSIIITSFDRFYYEQNQNELHAQIKIKKKTISQRDKKQTNKERKDKSLN